jgi:hypothetical protein
MSDPKNPTDPKEARRDRDETRSTEHDRADPSRKGSGPNNPLPGEPGGPSTAGYSEEDRKAAEEGQRKERDDKARDKGRDRDRDDKR